MNILIKNKTVDMVIKVLDENNKSIDVYDFFGRCIGTVASPLFIPTLIDGEKGDKRNG